MKTNAATYKTIIKLEYSIVLYSFLNNDSLAIVCIVNILIRQTWAFILWRPMSIYSKILNIIHMPSLWPFFMDTEKVFVPFSLFIYQQQRRNIWIEIID